MSKKPKEELVVVHRGLPWEKTYTKANVVHFWNIGDLSYLLHDYQLPLYEAIWKIINGSSPFGVINVSRQFGKTFVMDLIFNECGLRYKNYDMHFIGEDRAKLKKRVLKNDKIIMDACPYQEGDIRRPFFAGAGKDRANDEKVFPTTGATISFFDTKEDNYRGGSPNLVNPDEAAFIPKLKELIVREIEPSLLQSKGKCILTSTPPPSPDNYYNTMAERARAEGTLVTFTIKDNAMVSQKELDRLEREALQADGQLSNDYKREYLAELLADATLLILPGWDDKKNIIERTEIDKLRAHRDYPLWQKFISIDYGVEHFTVIGFYFYCYEIGKLVKEHSHWMRGERVSVGEIANIIVDEKRRLWNMQENDFPDMIVCDSNDPLARQTLVNDHGIPAMAVKKDARKSTMVGAFNDYVKTGDYVCASDLLMDLGCYRSGVWMGGEYRGKKFAESDVYGHYDAIDGDMYLYKMVKGMFPIKPERKETLDLNKQMAPFEVIEQHIKQNPINRFNDQWQEFDNLFGGI